jgi:hypothetical protein
MPLAHYNLLLAPRCNKSIGIGVVDYGAVAQLGERRVRNAKVGCSNHLG